MSWRRTGRTPSVPEAERPLPDHQESALRPARDFHYHPAMGVFTFVLIIIILSAIVAPIAKGMGERLGRGSPDNRDLAQLRAELERADQRIAEAERRLQLAEERMDFQEKLLSSRSSARRTPPPG